MASNLMHLSDLPIKIMACRDFKLLGDRATSSSCNGHKIFDALSRIKMETAALCMRHSRTTFTPSPVPSVIQGT